MIEFESHSQTSRSRSLGLSRDNPVFTSWWIGFVNTGRLLIPFPPSKTGPAILQPREMIEVIGRRISFRFDAVSEVLNFAQSTTAFETPELYG
jgi:hypothetical protein